MLYFALYCSGKSQCAGFIPNDVENALKIENRGIFEGVSSNKKSRPYRRLFIMLNPISSIMAPDINSEITNLKSLSLSCILSVSRNVQIQYC